MGYGTVYISSELIEEFLTTGKVIESCKVTSGVPEGAMLVGVEARDLGRYVVLRFRHDSLHDNEIHVAVKNVREVGT